MALSEARKKKLGNKYDPKNFFLKGYDYRVWLEELTDKEESTDIPPMPPLPLEGDEEEVKEETGLEILTPNKLLSRLFNIISTNKSWKQFIQIKK